MLTRLLTLAVSAGLLVGVHANPYWRARLDVAWSELTAQTLTEAHPSQFTTVTAEQLASIPAAACAGFTATQLSALSDSMTCPTAITSACFDEITPSALVGVPEQCKPTPVSDCSTWTGAQVAAMTVAQIVALPLSCLASWTADAASGLSFAAVAALGTTQIATFSAAAISGIPVDSVGGISGANCGGMGANCAGLTADQFSQLPTSAFYNWSPMCSASFTPAGLGGWSRVQMRSFSNQLFWAWSLEQIAGLSPLGASGISPNAAKGLPSDSCAAFHASQIALFRDFYEQHVCEQWSAACLAAISPAEYVGWTQECVQRLRPDAIAGVTAAQVANLLPTTFAILSNAQIAALPAPACSGITQQQMELFDFSYPSTQCGAITEACLNAIPPNAIAEATPLCVSQLPPSKKKPAIQTKQAHKHA